jgi:hypothetical protein
MKSFYFACYYSVRNSYHPIHFPINRASTCTKSDSVSLRHGLLLYRENRFKMSEKKVLRKIFRRQKDEELSERLRIRNNDRRCCSYRSPRFFCQWLFQPIHGPGLFIQFRNRFSQTVAFLGWVISSSQGLYLNTGQHKHRIIAYTQQTSMPWVGFEPTIPASGRAKTVHASDREATVRRTDNY